MKLLALLAFGLLPVLAMTAQTEPADTVKILDNADHVVITKLLSATLKTIHR